MTTLDRLRRLASITEASMEPTMSPEMRQRLEHIKQDFAADLNNVLAKHLQPLQNNRMAMMELYKIAFDIIHSHIPTGKGK